MKRSRDIGQELVAAREAGIRWKVLMQRYGLSRSRLYQIWSSTTPKMVHKQVKQSCALAILWTRRRGSSDVGDR